MARIFLPYIPYSTFVDKLIRLAICSRPNRIKESSSIWVGVWVSLNLKTYVCQKSISIYMCLVWMSAFKCLYVYIVRKRAKIIFIILVFYLVKIYIPILVKHKPIMFIHKFFYNWTTCVNKLKLFYWFTFL